MTKPRSHRLVTLSFSHYNEKARWSLDWCGIEYDEKGYLPGLSQLGVMMATRGRGGKADSVSSKFSTPFFITKDGDELCDSTDIAEWASKQIGDDGPGPLFPNADVRDLVLDVGRAQALAFRILSPLGKPLLSNALGITDEREAQAVERVREQVRNMDAHLAKSPFLAGDEFSAADITLACLMAPALLVQPEDGIHPVFPAHSELDAETRELIAEMRGTRAGKHALRMFGEHRREIHKMAQNP